MDTEPAEQWQDGLGMGPVVVVEGEREPASPRRVPGAEQLGERNDLTKLTLRIWRRKDLTNLTRRR